VTSQIFGTGGNQLGGMFNPGPLPPGGPLWIPYFMVADARRTAEIAKEIGAMIANGPMEVTGGDWVFTGIDPQNAMFAAHSKKKVATKDTKVAAANAKRTTKEVTTKKETAKKKGTKKATTKQRATKKTAGSARLQASKKSKKRR
jgi:hypothetical protein